MDKFGWTILLLAALVLLQISSMLLFVKHYKQEVLGVGEVALPGEGAALKEAAIQRTAKEAKDRSNSDKKDALEHVDHSSSNSICAAGSTNGTDANTKAEYVSRFYIPLSISLNSRLLLAQYGLHLYDSLSEMIVFLTIVCVCKALPLIMFMRVRQKQIFSSLYSLSRAGIIPIKLFFQTLFR